MFKFPHTRNDPIFTHNGSINYSPVIKMNTYSHKDEKVFSRHVMGLSLKVWLFRLSDFYPHEVWREPHFISFPSSLSFMLKVTPLFIFHGLFGNPHFLCTFAILFYNFSVILKMWVKGDFVSLLDLPSLFTTYPT